MKNLLDFEKDIVLDYLNNSATDILKDVYDFEIDDHLTLCLLFRDSKNYERMGQCLDFLRDIKDGAKDITYRENLEAWEFADHDIKYVVAFQASERTIHDSKAYDIPLEPIDYNVINYGIQETQLPKKIIEYLDFKCKEIISEHINL